MSLNHSNKGAPPATTDMKRKAMRVLSFAVAASAVFATTSTPLPASENDGSTDSSFRKTYVYRTFLKDDAVRTEAKDGVVTLTGTVADESHKALAQATVASLPGVTRVDNQLATKADVAAENADMVIGRRVKLALQLHRNANADKTGVAVKDGVVTLTGEASSTAQKELTAEYANDIEGVKEVRNDLTVAAAPAPEPAERAAPDRLDDASITAQVWTVLRTHRSSSSVDARVTTRDGEVTLSGIVMSAAEKARATRLVSDIRGVTSVKNQMTVMPVEEFKNK